MAKTLEELLEENPKAKQHEGVIRDTLRALEKLREAGFVDNGYDLEPPYGGTRDVQDVSTRKAIFTTKMTYCA
jgi:hypothetical protein